MSNRPIKKGGAMELSVTDSAMPRTIFHFWFEKEITVRYNTDKVCRQSAALGSVE